MSRDPILADRAVYRHWSRDTVRFCDQDAAGHVNNVAVCAYFETARLTFIRDIGMMRAGDDGRRSISAGLEVAFLRESHWPGEVELGCGVLAIGRSSVSLGAGAFRDAVCIATARMTIVRLDRAGPCPIEDEFRARLEAHRIAPA